MVVGVVAASVLVGAIALSPAASHSQQPQFVDGLVWDVAPLGLFADQRLRDAIDQMVDGQAVLRNAGVSNTLTYGGRAGPASGRTDQERLLFAAAGFDNPATQLAQQRRCRVWVGAPFLDAAPGSAVKDGLVREVVDGLAGLGVKVEPCDLTTSPQQADILLWRADQPRPLPRNDSRADEQSFLIALSRQGLTVPAPVRVNPPITGDGGLRASLR
jgi:hypothetical protein